MSIYKKISDNSKQFDTPEEFLKFYEKNKDTIDDTNTRALNLKYKIINHRIGRKDGKIIIYPVSTLKIIDLTPKQESIDNQQSSSLNRTADLSIELKKEIDSLKRELDKQRDDINKLIHAYQQIIEVLNQ